MPLYNTQDQYGYGMKLFHTVVAFLVIFQILLGAFMGYASRSTMPTVMTLHKSVGLLILLVMIFFAIWRFANPKPNWPAGIALWEKIAARSVHFLLYLLLFIMPLSGWLMSTAAGYVPVFFWWFKLPMPWVPQSKPIASVGGEIHLIAVWILSILIVIHILAALKHQFVDKDTILKRMF